MFRRNKSKKVIEVDTFLLRGRITMYNICFMDEKNEKQEQI